MFKVMGDGRWDSFEQGKKLYKNGLKFVYVIYGFSFYKICTFWNFKMKENFHFLTNFFFIIFFIIEKPSPFLSSFSMYENADKLFYNKYEEKSFECLNGIRVLSMAWIVMLHCYGGNWFVPAFYNKIEIPKVCYILSD